MLNDARRESVLLTAEPNVVFTTRLGGVSAIPYDTLNLSSEVGDDADMVRENRRRVSEQLEIDDNWTVTRQVHGASVMVAEDDSVNGADAIAIRTAGLPIAVFTADCLPIALVGETTVGAVHAGWRGLVAGVIEAAVRACGESMKAWIGPSIGPCHYETGPEVPSAFAAVHPEAPDFTEQVSGRTHFDLWSAARWQLEKSGVIVLGSRPPCTFCDPRFFSHRRDGVTGRQALVAWL